MKLGRWRIVDKFVIPNLDNPDDTYLTRWRILETPWFGLFLHRMDGPDSRPTLHDHPWSFVSFILRGAYHEMRLDKRTRRVRARAIRRVNVMRRDDAHYIAWLERSPTWTFVLVGKRRRQWGYWEKDLIPGSWSWTEFDKHRYGDEYDAAMVKRSRT